MISRLDLLASAEERLKDAETLYRGGRFDGTVYLSGYAIELALKARICKTLKWQSFPESSNEFRDYQSFKIHKLEILLRLSGIENKIIKSQRYEAYWQVVATWNPELRYKPASSVTELEAANMLKATKILLKALL